MSRSLTTSMMRLSSKLIVLQAVQNASVAAEAHPPKVVDLTNELAREHRGCHNGADARPVVLVEGGGEVHREFLKPLRDVATVIVLDDSNRSAWAKKMSQDDLDRTMTLRVNPADFDEAVMSLQTARSCMSRAERRGGSAQWKQKGRNGR